MNRYGFVKVAAITPKLKVANPKYNSKEIIKTILEEKEKNISIMVFPELCITGYTCGDLFFQKILLDESIESLNNILETTKDIDSVIIVGLPLLIDNKLYNCAAILQKGNLLGIVPKSFLPNYKEFQEKRYFTSGIEISKKKKSIKLLGKDIPFGNLLFKNNDFTLGIEICEDLWVNTPPSSYLTLQGADIIANLSASNELVGKAEYRKNLVSTQSARCICGYIYTSAGVHESTTDIVFSGDSLIAENGIILNQSKKFNRKTSVLYSEIDVDRLRAERMINKSFSDNIDIDSFDTQIIEIENIIDENFSISNFKRKIDRNPFIPNDINSINERCEEVFNIQVAGLAKRLEHTKVQDLVIGVSGGLDSTLALLVMVKTFKLLNIPLEHIHGITMPGFGTTNRTYNNSLELMDALRISNKEISIQKATLQHFEDIGQDINKHDITYENSQARERTQILMDYANKVNGFVIGTGDLSELALGWCTYNGDHMSMYAINSSVPKTLVKFLVNWIADNECDKRTRKVLKDILETPVSPELLPPKEDGTINQITESKIGPYELHDFFLYYAIKYGMTPQKILFLTMKAYEGYYSQEYIEKWLTLFYKRFFNNQFKRSCIPDGVKVGSISLSPRGDWRMPSDANNSLWVNSIYKDIK